MVVKSTFCKVIKWPKIIKTWVNYFLKCIFKMVEISKLFYLPLNLFVTVAYITILIVEQVLFLLRQMV